MLCPSQDLTELTGLQRKLESELLELSKALVA
jgi:hypothetical protein